MQHLESEKKPIRTAILSDKYNVDDSITCTEETLGFVNDKLVWRHTEVTGALGKDTNMLTCIVVSIKQDDIYAGH